MKMEQNINSENIEKRGKTYNLRLNKELIIPIALIAILLLLISYNIGRVWGSEISINAKSITGLFSSSIIPHGTPAIYGKELGIQYGDVSPNDPQKADQTIAILKNLDLALSLDGEQLQRYIQTLTQISCEYCCGAQSIIFSNGQPACGCAHSYAMRGLAKYLLKYHENEFTDEEILEELGKWKVLFFPGIHEAKAEVLKSEGIKVNYINLTSNNYRGIEQGKASSNGAGMVGGC